MKVMATYRKSSRQFLAHLRRKRYNGMIRKRALKPVYNLNPGPSARNRTARKLSQAKFHIRRNGGEPSQGKTATPTGNQGASLHIPANHSPWFIIGASVRGHGHAASNEPCQDAHKIKDLNNGWGIAVVADGAGSAKHSHLASAFLVEETIQQIERFIKDQKWISKGSIPGDEQWDRKGRKLLTNIRESLKAYSRQLDTPLSDLHSTLIAVIYSPEGLLVMHVGDGRAGYMDREGHWQEMLIPFQGEQVGETGFITLDMERFSQIAETRVIARKDIRAFVLLSDGCEKVCWETITKDPESGRYMKQNKPFAPFFEKNTEVLKRLQKENSREEIIEKWIAYLDKGHPGLARETDDKTMVLAFTTDND